MPKLLVFAPCEKIIVDSQGSTSLVGIMTRLRVQTRGQAMARNTVSPKEWGVYTLWKRENEDAEGKFVQILRVLWPDGEVFVEHRLSFVTQEETHQVAQNILGFPVGQQGPVTLNMWLERAAGPRIGEVHSFRIDVSHSGDDAPLAE